MGSNSSSQGLKVQGSQNHLDIQTVKNHSLGHIKLLRYAHNNEMKLL